MKNNNFTLKKYNKEHHNNKFRNYFENPCTIFNDDNIASKTDSIFIYHGLYLKIMYTKTFLFQIIEILH